MTTLVQRSAARQVAVPWSKETAHAAKSVGRVRSSGKAAYRNQWSGPSRDLDGQMLVLVQSSWKGQRCSQRPTCLMLNQSKTPVRRCFEGGSRGGDVIFTTPASLTCSGGFSETRFSISPASYARGPPHGVGVRVVAV